VDVVGQVKKQAGFFLAFDGVAVPLGWPQLFPHLGLGRHVEVEISEMAKPDNILVGRLPVPLLGGEHLPALLQGNVALSPLPGSLKEVEGEDKALRLFLCLGDTGKTQFPIGVGRVWQDNQAVGRVVVPGADDVPNKLILPEPSLEARTSAWLDDDAGVWVDWPPQLRQQLAA
jgi:hypothetical protein